MITNSIVNKGETLHLPLSPMNKNEGKDYKGK